MKEHSYSKSKYTDDDIIQMLEFLVDNNIMAGNSRQLGSISHIVTSMISYCPFNKREVENYLGQMYPVELEVKDTTESNTSASFLDLVLSIGRDGQLHTSINDKRDDFNFHITNLSSNIHVPDSPAYCVIISQPIRYARACFSYECFIVRATRLSNKGYLKKRLKSSLKKFYD